MPVQKLTNPVEQIRDKESCVASRRCELFARYEEITSSSTPDGASGDVTSGGKVTFEPGARSAWHTHALGQILIVTDGAGWIQQWGGPIEEIRKGDVIWIPAGVKRWHGATPAMTHIAIQEQLNGKAVEWMQKVTEEQYRK